jgi:hypothetical protein
VDQTEQGASALGGGAGRTRGVHGLQGGEHTSAEEAAKPEEELVRQGSRTVVSLAAVRPTAPSWVLSGVCCGAVMCYCSASISNIVVGLRAPALPAELAACPVPPAWCVVMPPGT